MKAARARTVLKRAIIGSLLIIIVVSSTYHAYVWAEHRVLHLFAFLSFFPLVAVVMITLVRCCMFLKTDTRKNLYLLIVSLLFVLISVELVLRFVIREHQSYTERNGIYSYSSLYQDQPDWYFLKPPNSTYTEQKLEFTYNITANSMGIRNKEIPLQKAKGEFRVLCMGDSFTEGYGASADSTWPALLEDELNVSKQHRRITVINGGMSAQDPFTAYQLLKDKLFRYEPDIVLTTINYSDISEVQVRGGFDRFRDGGIMKARKAPKIEFWYALSYIVRHVMVNGFDYDALMLNAKESEKSKEEAFNLIFECLLEFGKLSVEKEFKFMVVFHPGSFEVIIKQSAFQEMENRLTSETDITAMNLTSHFINEAKIDSSNVFNYFWPVDLHCKPGGYKVFAEGVAQKLKELGWIKHDIVYRSVPE